MTPAAATLVADIAAQSTDADRLRAGLPKLHDLLRDLIRAAVPPNPQFERERIIVDAVNPRELVFLLGLLSEGENEAALVLELAAETTRAEPDAPIAHLIDEAWYYLRTSIDERWQLDDGDPCAGAALAYLLVVLDERLEAARRQPPPAPPAVPRRPRQALLESLRDRFQTVPASLREA